MEILFALVICIDIDWEWREQKELISYWKVPRSSKCHYCKIDTLPSWLFSFNCNLKFDTCHRVIISFSVSAADLVLWRDKQTSGSILAGVTVIWLLFEGIGYHLLTFLCHTLIVFLTVWFVWSNAASFVNRSPFLFLLVLMVFYIWSLTLTWNLENILLCFLCFLKIPKDGHIVERVVPSTF